MARFHAEPAYADRPAASRVVRGAIVVCVAGVIGLVGATLGMIEDQGTCLRATGAGAGCALPAPPDPTDLSDHAPTPPATRGPS